MGDRAMKVFLLLLLHLALRSSHPAHEHCSTGKEVCTNSDFTGTLLYKIKTDGITNRTLNNFFLLIFRNFKFKFISIFH